MLWVSRTTLAPHHAALQELRRAKAQTEVLNCSLQFKRCKRRCIAFCVWASCALPQTLCTHILHRCHAMTFCVIGVFPCAYSFWLTTLKVSALLHQRWLSHSHAQ